MENEAMFFNRRENQLEKQRQEIIMKLARMMHDEWREMRRRADNSFEPRIKKTKDAAWIEKNSGNDDVDIANTDFEDLPRERQEENLFSAKVAVEKIEDALNIIHDKWLDRNDETAEGRQKVQYSRLPKEEQEKDMAILEKAIEIMRGKH